MFRVVLIAVLCLTGLPMTKLTASAEEWRDDNGRCSHFIRRASPECDFVEISDDAGVLGTCTCTAPTISTQSDQTDNTRLAATGVADAPVAAASTASVSCRTIVVRGKRYEICR